MSQAEFAEMARAIGDLGLRGAYDPLNVYPGSPFLPSRTLKYDAAVKEVRAHSQSILSQWSTLRQIVERHHEVLGKRWNKKSKKMQKEILQKAWGAPMSPTHRPDYEAYRRENTGSRHIGRSKTPDAYLFPYINLEDLASTSLTLFINSRGLNPPSAFARADLLAINLGSISHSIPEPAFLGGYTLCLEGSTVEEYGKFLDWDVEPEQATTLMVHRRHFTPGEGLQVLEIQERIYPFLIQCCEIVLHDLKSEGSLLDEKYPVLEQAPLSSIQALPSNDGNILPALSTISQEAPYRLPAQLDLDRLKGIFAAKRSAASDHLWAMREDPGYFAEEIKDWSEHRNDRLPDTNGQPHPTGPHTIDFWHRVIRNVISEAYQSYMNWDNLHRQVVRLSELMDKHKGDLSPENVKLPDELMIQMLKFRDYVSLKICADTPIHYMMNIQSSPALRQYFVRAPQAPGTVNMEIMPRSNDPIFHRPWGMLLILWTPQQRELFGLVDVVDYLEYLFQDPAEKKLLSPYMADRLADLGIYTRALKELESFHPWSATFDAEYKIHAGKMLVDIGKEGEPLIKMPEQVAAVMHHVTTYAMIGDGKFKYPVDKKRNKQTTEAMIQAEQNLDFFWEQFDGFWKKLHRTTVQKSMMHLAPVYRGQSLQRTQPWIEPAKESKQQSTEAGIGSTLWATETEQKTTPALAKPKQKTKGVATNSDQGAPVLAVTQPDEQPVFRVDKRALKVFNTLFFTANQSSQPGEVPWRDFLYAMTCTGFAAQKLYGSIWQFTPTALDVERSIQFHEPHPAVKMQYNVARRVGRRLNRAYGWYREMFVLDEAI
ncbi:hypothetical protein EG328_000533 [Venturia inaequalis]|uniref:Uncharacterized protein n=1 Tax=Venturia inaequalis TaxID=5025 RepID=A0A8H3VI15_VENIN|nr:hypothetical protein EG328_000533 [Venturia inaequalis]